MRSVPILSITVVAFLVADRAPAQVKPRAVVENVQTTDIPMYTPRPASTGVLRRGVAQASPATREPFVLEAGEHPLGELVDRAAVWLGRNYLRYETDFGAPNIKVNLQTTLRLDADGLERVLGQLLYAHGFVVVPMSEELQLYQVIQMNGPRRNDISARARHMTPDEVLEHADRMEQVLTVLSLEHIHAATASTATRPFFSQASSSSGALLTGNLGDSHSMLIQGFAPQVAAAIRMLRLADEAAGRAAELERVQDLEDRLEQLEQRAVMQQPQKRAQASTGTR